MLPVYIDMDDVICDSMEAFIRIIGQEFGKTVNFEDVSSFDLKVSFGLTDMEFDHFFQLIHKPENLLEFAPMDDVVSVVKEWTEKDLQVSIVTGRPPSAYDASIGWLEKHDVPFHSFVMVDKYSRENIDRTIALSMEALSEMKFCLAVEDSGEMARYLSGKMRTAVALFDRPWNRNIPPNGNIRRYESWTEIGEKALSFSAVNDYL